MERQLVAESGIAFAAYHELHAGPVHGVNPVRMLFSLIKLGIGSLQAIFKLSSRRPRVVLLTGGWANFPLALAADGLAHTDRDLSARHRTRSDDQGAAAIRPAGRDHGAGVRAVFPAGEDGGDRVSVAQ